MLVEHFTALFCSFERLQITREAYVCLKAITILHCKSESEIGQAQHLAPPASGDDMAAIQIQLIDTQKVQVIQEQFVKALQIHLSQFEDGPKLSEIFSWSVSV